MQALKIAYHDAFSTKAVSGARFGGQFQSFAIWQVIRKKMIFFEKFLRISFSYTKRVQKKIGRYYTMKFPQNPSVCISPTAIVTKI